MSTADASWQRWRWLIKKRTCPGRCCLCCCLLGLLLTPGRKFSVCWFVHGEKSGEGYVMFLYLIQIVNTNFGNKCADIYL